MSKVMIAIMLSTWLFACTFNNFTKEIWDLVAIGDSTPAGYGVPQGHSYVDIYAGYIEEDLNVEVVVHNQASIATRTVADHVNLLKKDERLRNEIREAEVILIWLGWHDVIPHLFGTEDRCYANGEVDLVCLANVTDTMQVGFDELLAEITRLADPSETLILIADTGIPTLFVSQWKADGTFEIMSEHAYSVWQAYLIEAAEKYGVRVVPTSAFAGQRVEKMQEDQLHSNELGHIEIADLHRSMGYGPLMREQD
jgi:lysophospholipase L1-like esterase